MLLGCQARAARWLWGEARGKGPPIVGPRAPELAAPGLAPCAHAPGLAPGLSLQPPRLVCMHFLSKVRKHHRVTLPVVSQKVVEGTITFPHFYVFMFWAPVSEPGFLDFHIFRLSILEILFSCNIFSKNMLVRYRGINNKVGDISRFRENIFWLILGCVP